MTSSLIDAIRTHMDARTASSAPSKLVDRKVEEHPEVNHHTILSFVKDGQLACANFSDDVYRTAERIAEGLTAEERAQIIREGASSFVKYSDVFMSSYEAYFRLHPYCNRNTDSHDFAVVQIVIAIYQAVGPSDQKAAIDTEYAD